MKNMVIDLVETHHGEERHAAEGIAESLVKGPEEMPKRTRPYKARHVLALLLVLSSSSVYGESPALDKEIVITIRDFVEQMCPTIPLEESSSSTELSGNTKAELKGLLKKLADLGIQGALKYQESNYQGLLQNDLYAATRDSTNCKMNVSTMMLGKLLDATSTALPRLPASARDELSGLTMEGLNLKQELERRMNDAQPEIRQDISVWHKKVENYLGTLPFGRTYVARFNNRKPTAMEFGGTEENSNAMALLSGSLEKLDEFIKE